MVKCGEVLAKESGNKTMRAHHAAQVRATISFPRDIYETLEVIAKEKKVSLAWVVREAAEKYVGDKWPLFSENKERKNEGKGRTAKADSAAQ